MNKNDFRYMRRGKQLADLTEHDFLLMPSYSKHGKNTESALLLLHGFSSSPAVFRYLIPQLTKYDALICPTLPGHGESINAFSKVKSTDWLSYTTKICGELCKKYSKVDVLGLSLGGLLACKLSEHFAFNHLYLLAPALKLKMNVKANLILAKVLHHLGFKELRGAAGNIITNEHAEISYKRIPITTIMEILNFIQHHQWKIPTCPTDLFLGTDDAVVCSTEVEKLFHNAPNITTHWLEHSAHVLSLDNDVNFIIECINN